MKFNSKSVIMKKAVSHLVPLAQPNQLNQYDIDDEVWKNAVITFNNELDKRPHVTMKFGDFKADILKIHRLGDALQLWIMVKQENVDAVDKMNFTLKGDVYFVDNSDKKVDTMVIKDVMYSDDKGIFTKNS